MVGCGSPDKTRCCSRITTGFLGADDGSADHDGAAGDGSAAHDGTAGHGVGARCRLHQVRQVPQPVGRPVVSRTNASISLTQCCSMLEMFHISSRCTIWSAPLSNRGGGGSVWWVHGQPALRSPAERGLEKTISRHSHPRRFSQLHRLRFATVRPTVIVSQLPWCSKR